MSNKHTADYTIRETCRLCDFHKLRRVLELPSTPLANEFTHSHQESLSQQCFPLYLATCERCGHVQLPVVVNPTRLFSDYVYVSGTSPSFISHLQNQGERIIADYGVADNSLIVEVGSNDGTALRPYLERGMRVLGIDPARDIASAANKSGIRTFNSFFDKSLAETILKSEGFASVIIANNVFAHADDLRGFAEAVEILLSPIDGIFVFEVQYLVDMIDKGLFDMIYHEHLSYHSIRPLVAFLESVGLFVSNVVRVNTHGGSIRGTCKKSARTVAENAHIDQVQSEEDLALACNPVTGLAETVELAKVSMEHFFKTEPVKIWGFGAPAKLTTLFYALKLDPAHFLGIVDDNPLKQGRFSPGTGIQILSEDQFKKITNGQGQTLLLFAWNFAEQIKNRFIDQGHTFLLPLPRLRTL